VGANLIILPKNRSLLQKMSLRVLLVRTSRRRRRSGVLGERDLCVRVPPEASSPGWAARAERLAVDVHGAGWPTTTRPRARRMYSRCSARPHQRDNAVESAGASWEMRLLAGAGLTSWIQGFQAGGSQPREDRIIFYFNQKQIYFQKVPSAA